MQDNFDKNFFKESNFQIKRVGDKHYAVLSDSEYFGKQTIVYQNPDRNKCIDYIDDREPAKKPTYYFIENLHEYIKGINRHIVYGTLEKCLTLYQEYSALEECQKQYNKLCGINEEIFAEAAKITTVLGVTINKNDKDIIFNINGNFIFNDAIIESEYGMNKYILDDLRIIKTRLDDQGKEIFAKVGIKDDFLFAGYSKGILNH